MVAPGIHPERDLVNLLEHRGKTAGQSVVRER